MAGKGEEKDRKKERKKARSRIRRQQKLFLQQKPLLPKGRLFVCACVVHLYMGSGERERETQSCIFGGSSNGGEKEYKIEIRKGLMM